MNTTIREWVREDLDWISRDWFGCCVEVPRSDMRLKKSPQKALAGWLNSRLRDPACFGLVAESGHDPAGFLLARVDQWESVPPIVEPRKLGIVDALYVREPYRKHGIAADLVERALSKFRARHAVAVETTYEAANEASARVWRRAGLEPWMVHAFRML